MISLSPKRVPLGAATARPILRRLTALFCLPITLTGCVSFSGDGGMAPVSASVTREIAADTVKISGSAEAAAAGGRVAALLARPLSADGAVQVALLNNRGLQANYNALGISEATFVEASLPPNPVISIERMAASGFVEIERRLVADLLSILTLPARREVAKIEFEVARQKAIEATFRTAAETRRAYYRAVADRQIIGFLDQALISAEAAADLTKELGTTGGATKLDQARASAFHAEVVNQLTRARISASTSREALTRQLGLSAPSAFSLPGVLPALPRLQTLKAVETDALTRRVDLIAARLELDAVARSMKLTKATRFISMLDGGLISSTEKEVDGSDTIVSRKNGFELEIAIPIFDFGQAAVRKSEETYMQAVNRLLDRTTVVRSEARAAYVAYRGSHEIAGRFQARIVPLRKTVNEEALLQYNGMLIDVFELLTTVREGVESNIASVNARRDYFLAAVDFQTALIGGGSAAANEGESQPTMTPAAGSGGH